MHLWEHVGRTNKIDPKNYTCQMFFFENLLNLLKRRWVVAKVDRGAVGQEEDVVETSIAH